MSGHSKWSTIKRAKAANDAKRSALFTKLANLITVAAREKGPDPETNFALRMAIDKARAANMPKDNIERAIKRATGEGGSGQAIEELYYEGFGPAQTQFIVKCLSDNKNRTAANIRHLFSKYGGSLGAVKWNFEQKGVIRISQENIKNVSDWEELELELIDVGVDDILREEEGVSILTAPTDLQRVNNFLETKKIATESAEIEYVAKDKANLTEADKEKVEKFIEELEDNPDVSDYYTNADL
ncbi:YebC/PmpR family DNA-binding transcriptional regulator [Candidatus Parcubacteria bacterium]|nr:MAG: YebC/PmpR family DNA-binding transcriptional regulator [Candidatus Parcubacteria bacterium]